MEAFFDRELQRLNFTTLRMDERAKEKKALDTAKVDMDAGDKVGLYAVVVVGEIHIAATVLSVHH